MGAAGSVQLWQTYIRAADTSDVDTDQHIGGVLEGWDWTVRNDNIFYSIQDE